MRAESQAPGWLLRELLWGRQQFEMEMLQAGVLSRPRGPPCPQRRFDWGAGAGEPVVPKGLLWPWESRERGTAWW